MVARPTLIVVDDEPDLLQSFHDLFRRRYDIHLFDRADHALRALEDLPQVHALISDQQMPGMSGVELLSRSRRLRPETMRLMMTGYADLDAVIGAINSGNVFRYISKPWHESEMDLMLRQSVEHYDLIAERNRLIAELQSSNEKLREADRLKNKFIEVASHELNTPVTIVLGLAELWRIMEGPNATPQERIWLDRIYCAGKRLAGTIEKMFTLIKTDHLVHTLELRNTEIAPLIHRAVADLQPFLTARKQTIEMTIADDLGSAEIDASKVSDVLANLLVNAVKFTPDEGQITINARSEGPSAVVIEVVDRGVGIGADEFRHLFQPFFTGYDTMHHSSGEFQFGKRGIGLGLCVVKTFVELHGGSVVATSTAGAGSTFRIRLPRQRELDLSVSAGL